MISNHTIITIVQSILLIFIGTFVNVNANDTTSKITLKFIPMILGVIGLSFSIFEIL